MTINTGIVGVPPLAIIKQITKRGDLVHDLDEPIVCKDLETASPYLPRVYCAILRTVVVNAINLELDRIYIDVGPGKCDCALHLATILKTSLYIPIIETRNDDKTPYGFPLCRAQMDLTARFEQITKRVQSPAQYDLDRHPPCQPVAGFWGVPPRDFSILSLFPDKTHIYGWTRCMENKTPADVALESSFNPEIPTIFFAQSFCAKTALAKFLATRHPHGLYLDVDSTCSSSAKAKVQAFLELSGVTT